jgi:hypothetical protein
MKRAILGASRCPSHSATDISPLLQERDGEPSCILSSSPPPLPPPPPLFQTHMTTTGTTPPLPQTSVKGLHLVPCDVGTTPSLAATHIQGPESRVRQPTTTITVNSTATRLLHNKPKPTSIAYPSQLARCQCTLVLSEDSTNFLHQDAPQLSCASVSSCSYPHNKQFSSTF